MTDTYRVLTTDQLATYRAHLPHAYGQNVAVIGDLLATIDALTAERDQLLRQMDEVDGFRRIAVTAANDTRAAQRQAEQERDAARQQVARLWTFALAVGETPILMLPEHVMVAYDNLPGDIIHRLALDISERRAAVVGQPAEGEGR